MSQSLVPSENWDDDFEFSQSTTKPKDARKIAASPLEPRQSVASSHFSDWDVGKQSPSKASVAGASGITSMLGNWAEPGPSTPTKHGVQAENWDDDFEDKADSPPNRRHHAHRASHQAFHSHHPAHILRTRHSYHTPPRPKPPVEPENWDDDFDDHMDPAAITSPTKTDNDNTPITKRTRREAYADTSDEEDDADFGFAEDKEEDKTVTARSQTAPMTRPGSSNSHSHSHASSRHSPLPPVPALPHTLSPIEPFPRSPTVSVFSIPTTSGRNSIGYFNSTSHLVLSGASSLAMLPPSPPTQRERRRLRKKSRPPNMDNNVFELIEEHRDTSSPPLPPSTPERDRASSPSMVPMMASSSVEATPSGSKSPLLSRIGSVKKWGARRKRASTGPAEVAMHELGPSSSVVDDDVPQPPSTLEQTPSNRNRNANIGWFFRPGGAHYGAWSPPPGHAELRHEKSLERAQLRPGHGTTGEGVPMTPRKKGIASTRWSTRKASGLEHASSTEFTADGSSLASGVTGPGKPSLGLGRRPTSMQVPNGAALATINGSNRFASVGTRHASYGSSVGRASSSRVFSTPTPTESIEHLPPMPALPLQSQSQEGSRSFMGSVRKISLVGKHMKKKSLVDVVHAPPAAATSLQDDLGDDTGRERDADGDVRMETESPAHTSDLLPPIELHPPSPPRAINGVSPSHAIHLNPMDSNEPGMTSMSAPVSLTMSPMACTASPATSCKATPKTPSSPQSASLGRATQAPNPSQSNACVPRRNSLGDLKIPARISQAQIGLKRDLGMVREFATSVDRLKELQSTYHLLLAEVQRFLENAVPSRATSPNVFGLVRPRSRLRSNTSPSANTLGSFSEYKHVAATFYAITVKYKVSWECAELLIELGGGAPVPASPAASAPSSSLSAPTTSVQAELDGRKSRERAITLSGEESMGPPAIVPANGTAPTTTAGPLNASWRASTGRHDLSQRQLVLLRDMLSHAELLPEDSPPRDDNVNKHWRWGDAMSSTVTLPSEESEPRTTDRGETTKKKRRGGRMGLTGLRDMLRMLKRSHSEQGTGTLPSLPADPSTASLSTESSHYSHYYSHPQLVPGGVQRPRTSAGPESVRSRDAPTHVNSPYAPPLPHKSPRRPSLASIFRIGQKYKGASSSTGESSQDSRSDVRSASRGSNMTEDDWDRIESAIDLDGAARALGIEGGASTGAGMATIKGRKGRAPPFLTEYPMGSGLSATLGSRPVTPHRGQDVAQVMRIDVEASPRSLRPMRSTRLSNVEEVEDGERPARSKATLKNPVPLRRVSPQRPPSRGQHLPGSSRQTGSIQSAPPTSLQLQLQAEDGLPDIKLSMTPENIKPLLDNAKEVHTRCHACVRELRALMETIPVGAVSASVS